MQNFKNRVVIITGASAGVGAETARAFAQQKAKLVLIARGEKALKELCDELQQITDVLSFCLDVSDVTGFEALLKEVEQHFGAVHILINNAGYHQRGDVEKNLAVDLAKMVDVNLRAPIAFAALTMPYIKKQKAGAIVNVGSLAGRTPLQGAATYSATKAGLRAFTYALSDEIDHDDIHIGLVSPGPIETGFIMSEIDAVEDIVFSQGMSSPQQVAQAILKVASGKAVEISLPKSGGYLTTLSYLSPWLRRKLRPALYEIGRKAKEKYKQKYQ